MPVDAQMITVDARAREKSTSALPDRAFGFHCFSKIALDLAQADQKN